MYYVLPTGRYMYLPLSIYLRQHYSTYLGIPTYLQVLLNTYLDLGTPSGLNREQE